MKILNKGEFNCPERYSVGGVDGNGQQYICVCLNCRLDDRGICNGDQLVCENNWKQNSFSLYLMNGNRYIKNIKKGKGETLDVSEVLKFAEKLNL